MKVGDLTLEEFQRFLFAILEQADTGHPDGNYKLRRLIEEFEEKHERTY
jgi:polyhydroxyalkanoate synthesis regulator phasin